MTKCRGLGWAGHVASMGEGAFKVLIHETIGKKSLKQSNVDYIIILGNTLKNSFQYKELG